MNKYRIGIDIDGVLYPFVDTFRQHVQASRVQHYEMPPPSKWAFWDEWSLTKEEFGRLFDSYIQVGGFLWGQPFAGAVEAIRKVQENHRVVFVTARGMAAGVQSKIAYQAKMDTFDWLQRFGLSDIPLAFAQSKDALGVDVHVDDAVHHLEECDAAGITPICFDASHNQSWLGHRIEKWEELPVLLKAIL